MPPTNTSIGDCFKKVKSPHPGTFRLPKVLAVRRQESPCKVFLYLYAVSGRDGLFELDAAQIAQQTGLSRKTVYKAIALLQRVRLLSLVEPRTGRGKHSLYKLNWHKRKLTNNSAIESVTPISSKDVKTYKTHSKDTPAGASEGVGQSLRGTTSVRGKAQPQGQSPKKTPLDYQGAEAERVVLVLGARFYRHVMQAIRLGLESWALGERHRDALEGFFGNRIDGASLAYARQLKDQIWTLKSEIEALAASGASPRRVCSFVAGKLAGVPEKRSRREVLKRTAQLISDVEQLERRITGLKAWLAEREREYHEGRVCARCGYRHSPTEYRSGYRDGTGALCCFGYGRVKLEELQEQLKLRSRHERCRQCGGSLRGGHVEGLCWRCYNCNVLGKGPRRVASPEDATLVAGPVLIGDLIAATLPNTCCNYFPRGGPLNAGATAARSPVITQTMASDREFF